MRQQSLKGNPVLLSFADMQHTTAGDLSPCMDEDVQKGILAHSALYHGSNSCLLLKHQNIYFYFFWSIKCYQVRAESVLEPSLNVAATRSSKGRVQMYFICTEDGNCNSRQLKHQWPGVGHSEDLHRLLDRTIVLNVSSEDKHVSGVLFLMSFVFFQMLESLHFTSPLLAQEQAQLL